MLRLVPFAVENTTLSLLSRRADSPLLVGQAKSSGEAFGLAAAFEPLHVDDLAVVEGEDLVALLAAARCLQVGRGDDDVVAHLLEFRFHIQRLIAAFLELELQDLTGLIGAASGGRLLPPEVSMRDAAPLGICAK